MSTQKLSPRLSSKFKASMIALLNRARPEISHISHIIDFTESAYTKGGDLPLRTGSLVRFC